MALMKNMTVFKRTIIWLSAISLICFIIIAFIVLEIRDTVRNNGLNQIQKILDHKLEMLNLYVNHQYAAINNLTQLFNFASQHHDIFNKNFWNTMPPHNLRENMATFTNQNGFYDIFLVTVDGDIVYTVKHENDLQTNLLNGRYQHTELARVFKAALKNTKPNISDFNYYEPSHDYAAFIAEPITVNGTIIGVTVAQIDNKGINSIINDYSELGKTGEIITSVVRKGKLMSMTHARYSNLKAYTFFDLDLTAPISGAIKGDRGRVYTVDILQNEVAAAWGYQKDLRWGIMAKINALELLDTWYKLTVFLMILFFSGFLIIVSMVVMAFRSFTKPIQELTKKALRVSSGDYKIDVDINKYDHEWQLLIDAFNQMSMEINRKIMQLNEQNDVLIAQKHEIEELNLNLEARIKAKSEKLQEYIDIMDQYIITSQTDTNGVITYVSNAFCQVSGYTKEDLIGQNHRIFRHPDMPDELFADLWKTISSGKTWRGEVKNLKADGSYYWVDTMISPNLENGKIIGYTAIRDRKIIGYTAVGHDITDKKIIEELSITDSMTGLYNRRYYATTIQEEMNRAKRYHFSVALMMFDVDYFKLYNDTYGHLAGDNVLIQIAEVLKLYTSRSGEYAFRLGGEEFAILISNMSAKEYFHLGTLICRDIEALELTHEKNTAGPYVTISIGIAVYQHDSKLTCEDLYKEADTQLYLAKEGGRNQVAIDQSLRG